ncbi:MAG TPA: YkgJ family cysteine cluster protein [Gemmataceae bacterium]|nr:YkgJ family cysteine cluster protein [Gemmataceae bacterium]
MPLPIRQLPILQNWDCHNCGGCCREYTINITEEEHDRIVKQGWDKEPEFQNEPLFVNAGSKKKPKWRLAQRPDSACIFLTDNGLCKIHAKFGIGAKPLACRVYPFMLVPVGDHWRVGMRFACPSAAENKGRPVRLHGNELREYVAGLEKRGALQGGTTPAPPLQGRQTVSWRDLFTFEQALEAILNQQGSTEFKLRKCLWLAGICRQAKFDKISGGRLEEFLNILINGMEQEVAADPDGIPLPSRLGRLLFRQLLVLYVRKDVGQNPGLAKHGRIALTKAAIRFARGTGPVPKVHGLLPDTTFEKLEEPIGALPEECEAILHRYYITKLQSMQFCGATNYHHSFWDGLESLVLTFPAMMWLMRAFAELPRREALLQAMRIVDDNFGFHPLMGSRRQKFAQRLLSLWGDIPRLVAWYGR